jgi:hypothetical protein
MKPIKETILWGTKKDYPTWQEDILSTVPKNFEKVKELASMDGYNKFRISEIDNSTNPWDIKKIIK